VWAGQLGDGRALLLGQVRNRAGELWDIQLKGSGLTPYSRMGDGRAVMRSCIREYLCSEAMAALGIPTTRALCIVATGERVRRETLEPGAVMTRLSPSHIRFGHFEHFGNRNQVDAVKTLADYVMAEHFPECLDQETPYLAWFRTVMTRTAQMIAQWQAVGFAHGVMNTDNMSILGLTLDYGPFGFMEAYNPGFVCNHSDHAGRYAFDQQPFIAFWNLHALAHSLQSLFSWESAQEVLSEYHATFTQAYHQRMCEKLGIQDPRPEDEALWQSLLAFMAQHQADYTRTFRQLAQTAPEADNTPWLGLFHDDPDAQGWLTRYFDRVASEPEERIQRMNRVNPRYVLRNWVAETVIRTVEDAGDLEMLDHALSLVQSPYDEHPDWQHFATPAPESMQTLCVSCSS